MVNGDWRWKREVVDWSGARTRRFWGARVLGEVWELSFGLLLEEGCGGY